MKNIIQQMLKDLKEQQIEPVNIMEVCGTHTMAIARSGLRSLLPKTITLLSGPGCPVCVTTQYTIDYAIKLAQEKNVIITTFGDMVRVPGSDSSLEMFSPRIVYSTLDALTIARENPDKEVVFIGVGFETTSPTVAAAVVIAEQKNIKNFSVLPAFKTIPPALDFIAQAPEINVQGFLLPGHVSTIIGSKPYQFLSETYGLPGCVTGFEPIDIVQGIYNLAEQIRDRKPRIHIEYTTVVKPNGNINALETLYRVFTPCDAEWRAIGTIKDSGLTFRDEYKSFDATRRFTIKLPESTMPKGCLCGSVLLGLKLPPDCGLFGTRCTPLAPIGPCMVSSEGACAAYYKYGIGKEKV